MASDIALDLAQRPTSSMRAAEKEHRARLGGMEPKKVPRGIALVRQMRAAQAAECPMPIAGAVPAISDTSGDGMEAAMMTSGSLEGRSREFGEIPRGAAAIGQSAELRAGSTEHGDRQKIPFALICDTVLRLFSKPYKVTREEFFGRAHHRPAVRLRAMAFLIGKDCTRLSLSELGRKFERDHTTVLHGIRKGKTLMRNDPHFQAEVGTVKQLLGLAE